MSGARGEARRFLRVALVVESALLILAWGLGLLLDRRPLEALRFTPAGLLLGTAAALGSIATIPWSLRTGWRPMAALREGLFAMVRPWLASLRPWELLLISALAGVAEEALFRGLLQGSLEGPLGAPAAIGIGAAVFGLAHPVTPLYAALAAILGAAWGLLFHLTGDLAAPALAHGLHDLAALAVLQRMVRRPGAG